MGSATVTVELSNYGDVLLARAGHMRAEHVRRMTLVCTVDFGVMHAVLPQHVVELLGLPAADVPALRNGERRARVKNAYVQLFGRGSVFNASVEPNRTDALIGAIVMEDLDLIIDCGRNQIVPRDPNGIISEVE